ncbi:hypothetical protein M434DRAFT_14101 [Hypoxylon sp. CO27-5]|nr:hypothetical protein M434DRAFT_14101 [Hypoxylon sp. CO27-5]
MANGDGDGDDDKRDERQQSPAAVKLEPTRMVRTVKGNWKKSDEEEVDYEKRGLISVSCQTDSSYLGKLPGLVVHDDPDDFFFSLSSPYPIELSGKKTPGGKRQDRWMTTKKCVERQWLEMVKERRGVAETDIVVQGWDGD